jgi:YbbR domain-containing protein
VAELYDSSSPIDIVVSGRKSVLSELSEHAISASVDCEGLTEGTYRLSVQMNLEEGCSVEKGAKVKVVIRRKNNTSEKATATPSATATPKPQIAETPEPTVEPEEEEE